MKTEDHHKITKMLVGDECKEVHRWLDATHHEAAMLGNPYAHWANRHHLEAIDEQYGDHSTHRAVAVLHVICDWISHFGEAYLPENSEEVIVHLVNEERWRSGNS